MSGAADSPQKFCTRCQLEHPIEEFGWKIRAKGRRQSHCREAQKAIARRTHAATKASRNPKIHMRKRAVAATHQVKLQLWLSERSCFCGSQKGLIPVVEGPVRISDLVGNGNSWTRIEVALLKAEVLCRSCAGARFGRLSQAKRRHSGAV